VNRFVLDCSMTMAWCFEDESSPRTISALAALEASEAVVPSLWPLEVANVLAICQRRQRIGAGDISRFLTMLNGLPITVDDQTPKRAFGDVLALARTRQVSAYDAAYLELAMREGCPLASLDARLNATAADLGIRLLAG